ncbi:MAG: hypothetical protein EOP34_02890 [Rickettsiales bacterium]|nr:MAG: hypothetical protein EOP34_02890 [Rickettsiales bacterium]
MLFLIAVLIPIYIFIKSFFNTPVCLFNNPPKAHPFLEIALNSAIDDIIAIVEASGFISSIVPRTAYLYSVGIFLSMVGVVAIPGTLIPLLINLMEQIIQNTIEIHARALALVLDNIADQAVLREIHAYLTPYIRSYESIFNAIQRIIMFLISVDSPYYHQVDDLAEQFRVGGNNLLDLYRDIETELDISIEDSPISTQERDLERRL